MSRLKISAISYLNTAPLMWDFEHGKRPEFDLSYTIPSACAQALAEGSADIGIIPAAAYTTIPDLVIVPDVAIAARREVRSILLVSKVSVEKVRTVALDTSSMTSVALTKVLFAKWMGGTREYIPMAPQLDAMLAHCDAALLIGDPALQVNRTQYVTLDLAEEWIRKTGKAFVFAFWAIRRASLAGKNEKAIAAAFRESRDHGLDPANLAITVRDWSQRLSLPESTIRAYLAENIHYSLDGPCLEGLALFYKYAAEIGALPSAPKLLFLKDAESAA
jgi:chorismate dehydratase